jgi:hypothetical protein
LGNQHAEACERILYNQAKKRDEALVQNDLRYRQSHVDDDGVARIGCHMTS